MEHIELCQSTHHSWDFITLVCTLVQFNDTSEEHPITRARFGIKVITWQAKVLVHIASSDQNMWSRSILLGMSGTFNGILVSGSEFDVLFVPALLNTSLPSPSLSKTQNPSLYHLHRLHLLVSFVLSFIPSFSFVPLTFEWRVFQFRNLLL